MGLEMRPLDAKNAPHSTVKSMLVLSAVRMARFYIRYSPWCLFKNFLWKRVKWRSLPYIARTSFGALMEGNSLDAVQGRIYYFGVWEPNLTAFIKERLSGTTGRIFVDVGANVGYFSLLAATLMPAGKIVSIEAFPSIFTKLRKNIQLNHLNNVRAVPCAATEQECEIEMFHAGSTNEGATTTLPGVFSSEPIRVTGKPLSSILTADEVKVVRIIKMDVEGAEYSVIQGFKVLLDQLPFDAELVIEITPSSLGTEKMKAIFELFDASGYVAYELRNSYLDSYYLGARTIERPFRLKTLPDRQTDVVFSRTVADWL
jgi:FkbM family methyltransferase